MHPLQSKLTAIQQQIALLIALYDREGEKGVHADEGLIMKLDKQLQELDHRRDECLAEMKQLGVPTE